MGISNTKFHKWVRRQHRVELAHKLGVTENAVRLWAIYGKLPKDSLKRKIVRLAKGELTYDDFFK